MNIIDWKDLDEKAIFKLMNEIFVHDRQKGVLFRVIRNLFYKPADYELYGSRTGSILFFYSPDYYRLDHVKQFQVVAKCADNAFVMEGKKKENGIKRLSLKAAMRNLQTIPSLLKWHTKKWGSVRLFLHMLPCYWNLNHEWDYIRNINLDSFRALVVYFDARYTDAALVELFRMNHKKTATLQHGYFTAHSDKAISVYETGLELRCSNADYLLAWNEATRKEAQKQGIGAEKVHVLGIPRYINSDVSHEEFNFDLAKGAFGVILGIKDNERENIAMIVLANEIAKIYNYRYYLKYHPVFKGDEYLRYVDKTYYIANIDKSVGLQEYSKKMDFFLVGNSTVMLELLYLKKRAFHYSDISRTDKYSEMPEISFSNIKDFTKTFKASKEVFEIVRERYCGPENPKEQYRSFFEEVTQ